jgi:hypothetical protein
MTNLFFLGARSAPSPVSIRDTLVCVLPNDPYANRRSKERRMGETGQSRRGDSSHTILRFGRAFQAHVTDGRTGGF